MYLLAREAEIFWNERFRTRREVIEEMLFDGQTVEDFDEC